MLYEVLMYLHNLFADAEHSQEDEFTITDGMIVLRDIKVGQYYLIEGSTFNDGVHQYPSDELINEQFDGVITPLKIPQALLSVVDEIETWQKEYGTLTPFQSESFADYSYTKATYDGKQITWQDAFKGRLSKWRKI